MLSLKNKDSVSILRNTFIKDEDQTNEEDGSEENQLEFENGFVGFFFAAMRAEFSCL
ncbi:hypothetical protein [Dyadobacter sp. CY326]|uniref:hypothetical protein n=1 Tax=Dyadobacter sp. CY326 TaxID=2907300 RepID=UPI001F317DFB|nr:hypothetical protein [Dyadobacter sp. CY326]MCE7063876.1 hypothetical protein [Dyadobacter sp. CY326]